MKDIDTGLPTSQQQIAEIKRRNQIQCSAILNLKHVEHFQVITLPKNCSTTP
jgi:hypothetical protein